MARFVFTTSLAMFLCMALLQLSSCSTIGGGLNTDLDDKSSLWLRTALANLRRERADPAATDGKSQDAGEMAEDSLDVLKIISSQDEPAAPVLLHRPGQESSLSSADNDHPFLRAKRSQENCPFPDSLPDHVSELNSHLNASQMLGLNPTNPEYSPLPTPNNRSCSGSGVSSWWPGQTVNLRSTCPWEYEDRFLGDHTFPNYIREAKCICKYCMNANSNGCAEIRMNVTVFRRQGCRDGVALLNKVEIPVTVGCHCVEARKMTIPDYENLSY